MIHIALGLGLLLGAGGVGTAAAAPLQGPGGGGGVAIAAGEECPAGMTEVRPGNCRAPEIPAPSILDYRPRSTLVTVETPVPRARYPVVDIHGHANLTTPGRIDEIVAALDELNIQVYVAADNLSGERLTQTLEALRSSPHGDRFRVLAGIDLRDVGPGLRGPRRPGGGSGDPCRRRRCRRGVGRDWAFPSGRRTDRACPSTIRSSIRCGRR